MLVLSQVEEQLSIERVLEVERLIGLTLPDEYKAHLLKYNGGRCIPNKFSFVEEGKTEESCIDWFLAIYDGEYDNLTKYIMIYKIDEMRLPKHILPIAHDPGGNLICISCDQKDNGYIYFWDHEKEGNNTNLYLIEQGFSLFLNSLR